MSSSTTHEPLAIRLQTVSKIYRLHGSQGDQLIDVLGLQRFGFKTKTQAKEFAALSNVSLDVPRGHRIGIVGRNGAGKTTLLKLICGNFAPTHGEVEVNGGVQALMNVGLGFHPEYTGRENVEASLQYNGLNRTDYQQAMDGIIEFCELGDFLDQPFKTYSLGMQARLMFAAATAIRPDILIVDEVLGAGDAYFVAKSKTRVQNLVNSGCTMLLVSHSMQQVLELCDDAIWLDNGSIRLKGDAFSVVKAYEEFLHKPISNLGKTESRISSPQHSSSELPRLTEKTISERLNESNISNTARQFFLQVPDFCPHRESVDLPEIEQPKALKFLTRGGASRWNEKTDLQISAFTIVTENGETNKLISMRPAKFIIAVTSSASRSYKCRYGVVLFDHMGVCAAKIVSPVDIFFLEKNTSRVVELLLNPNQLGPGDYVISLSLHEAGELEAFGHTSRYDLLNRSFELKVEMRESLLDFETKFFHSAEWVFDTTL